MLKYESPKQYTYTIEDVTLSQGHHTLLVKKEQFVKSLVLIHPQMNK